MNNHDVKFTDSRVKQQIDSNAERLKSNKDSRNTSHVIVHLIVILSLLKKKNLCSKIGTRDVMCEKCRINWQPVKFGCQLTFKIRHISADF